VTQLEKLLLSTTKYFIASLLPWTSSAADAASVDEGLKSALDLADTGEDGYWTVRARMGWYKEFVRLYSVHLGGLAEVVERDVMAKWRGEGVEGRAEGLVRGVWAAAVGAEE
jgi:nuclear cap-binding protein subunit 1